LTLVVDTNVVAALMLKTEQNPVVADCFVRDCDWQLPVLWRSEFRHVLLKYVRANLFSRSQVSAIWMRAMSAVEREFINFGEAMNNLSPLEPQCTHVPIQGSGQAKIARGH
jgi:predicted nucleic acid-binding protein